MTLPNLTSESGRCDLPALDPFRAACIVLWTVFLLTLMYCPVHHHAWVQTNSHTRVRLLRPPSCCKPGLVAEVFIACCLHASPRYSPAPRRLGAALIPADSDMCSEACTTAPIQHEYCSILDGLPPRFFPKNPAKLKRTMASLRMRLRTAGETVLQYSTDEINCCTSAKYTSTNSKSSEISLWMRASS